MADVQRQFEQFHKTIRADFEMSQTLQEKRDIVVDKIRDHLRDHGLPVPTVLLQGSYKMKTGVQPIEAMEYDIDIGLRFPIYENDYSTATVRGWVFDAVDGHTKRVEDRGPCIRVCYEAGYHLDIVCYAVWEDAYGTHFRLAHRDSGWRETNPQGLLDYVDNARNAYQGTEDTLTKSDQFRRCVRALRRWADELRPVDDANDKPSGIALVLLAIQYGLPPSSFFDGRSNDRSALEQLTSTLVGTIGRLRAVKPTPEHEDVLGGFSDTEMDLFKDELADLNSALVFAANNADPVEACNRLREVFGDDFPVPDPQDTAKKAGSAAIITSSSSA